MKKFLYVATAVFASFIAMSALLAAPAAWAEEPNVQSEEQGLDINWEKGPTTAALGDIAEIEVPEGYVFAGAEDTRKLLEAMQDIPSGKELGFMADTEDDWFVIFEFDDIGYVKDDEKDSLDADAILKSIRESNDKANEIRRKKGWSVVNLKGWYIQPRYNPSTNNLEWAVEGVSNEGGPVTNLNTRILGRNGVMEVTLVTDPSRMEDLMPVYEGLLSDFSYNKGKRYSEYVQGDKLAKVGLTALIVGGAAAAAAKTGLLKGLWKIIVAGAVAVGAFFKKLFNRNKA